eukprot:1430850-Heterocapsa_arctica.AAC.1
MGQVQTLSSPGGACSYHKLCRSWGVAPPPSTDVGKLQAIAAKVLMNILYAARLARFDLLRA